MKQDALAKIENVQNDLTLSQVGHLFATSGFFSDVKGEAQAITKILAGAENGFGPFTSMSGIHIIKGKVELGADLIATGIKKSGKYEFRVKELTTQSCTIEFFEKSEFTNGKWQSIGVSTFTQDDAKAAGISGDMYKKYGRNMLFARAITNGQAWYCPDVFESRVYSEGEISGYTQEEPVSQEQIDAIYNDTDDDLWQPEPAEQQEVIEARQKVQRLWDSWGIHPKAAANSFKAYMKKHYTIENADISTCTEVVAMREYGKYKQAKLKAERAAQQQLDLVKEFLGEKQGEQFKKALKADDYDTMNELYDAACQERDAIALEPDNGPEEQF